MTSPAYCVLDGDGGSNLPALPAVDCEELGGLLFVDSTKAVPRTHEHVSMLDVMQWEMVIQRICQVIPLVRLWCTAGNPLPTIDICRSVTTNVTAANITVTRTSAGIYTFTLPLNSLPTMPGRARIFPESNSLDVCSQTGRVILINHYEEDGGALTDVGRFSLDIFGI